MKAVYYAPNMLRLCMDHKNGKKISGRVYGTFLKEPVAFEDFAEMILRVDEAFDLQGFPQSFQDKRSFRKTAGENHHNPNPPVLTDSACFEAEEGTAGTYVVLVATRQNATWQGSVLFPDGSPMAEFASEMELFGILTRM